MYRIKAYFQVLQHLYQKGRRFRLTCNIRWDIFSTCVIVHSATTKLQSIDCDFREHTDLQAVGKLFVTGGGVRCCRVRGRKIPLHDTEVRNFPVGLTSVPGVEFNSSRSNDNPFHTAAVDSEGPENLTKFKEAWFDVHTSATVGPIWCSAALSSRCAGSR